MAELAFYEWLKGFTIVGEAAVTGIATVLAAWVTAQIGDLKKRAKKLEEKHG